ncbi:MAG: AAA family ATPase [Clostridiales bacterium]|nr:AAA family ATPase [Clostridiales bacterium]
MFRRKIQEELFNYFKAERPEKILVVHGARQIGKSFIIRETAKEVFEHYAEIDLKDDYEGEKRFSRVKTTKDFYLMVSSLFGDLNNYDDTIIFLDEIQFYPHLLTMLKPLNQEKKYRFIVSGSLLGITLKHSFIPMGSITERRMYPMDFEEFLWANNYGADSVNYLKHCFDNLESVNDGVHNYTLGLFKDYLLCGGLPDAVKEYVSNRNVSAMRRVHSEIFEYYKDDCAKYDEEHSLKIRRIYDLMSSYMTNKVKRVQFKSIDRKANSSLEKYEDEFDYLFDSGIALASRAVSNPVFPLSESTSKNLTKAYYNDVGLLTNILYKTNISAVLDVEKGVNLGSVYETASAMELIAHGHELFYFDSRKTGEVDFLINDYDNLTILPVEIKSGNDQNNYRALPKLVDPNGGYKLKKGYVFGNKNIVKKEGNIITLPIYLIMFL